MIIYQKIKLITQQNGLISAKINKFIPTTTKPRKINQKRPPRSQKSFEDFSYEYDFENNNSINSSVQAFKTSKISSLTGIIFN